MAEENPAVNAIFISCLMEPTVAVRAEPGSRLAFGTKHGENFFGREELKTQTN
jgi:hypothetical protein